MRTNSDSTTVRATIRKPIVIKRGNVAVKIYQGENRVNGVSYPIFTVAYYSGATRVRQKFADLEKARTQAELAATKLANGENEVLKLTSLDRASYLQAKSLLEPLGLALNVAVADYINAIKSLPSNATLKEAVEFFVRRNPANFAQKSVSEVVRELTELKEKAGRGEVHLKDIESRLGRFAAAFPVNIATVTPAMIERFLTELQERGCTGRTRRNYLRLIVMLFRFAARRKYLSKEAVEELESIEKPDEEPTEIEIFNASELRLLFASVRREMVPWLAIAAFAGLRNAELQRLEWSEVNLAERHIEVPATKAKTASRRIVPICDALATWLAPQAQSSGQVAPFENMAKQIDWLVRDVNKALKTAAESKGEAAPRKFVWKRNALRHSFVSYRLAQIKDTAEVALEAGNSPTMIFRNYRKLVTETEAKNWFGVLPPQQENVISFSDAKAA